jgi:hypothetical protein
LYAVGMIQKGNQLHTERLKSGVQIGVLSVSLLCYKSLIAAGAVFAAAGKMTPSLLGECKSSCAASVNNKPAFSPREDIRLAISHSWLRSQSVSSGRRLPLLGVHEAVRGRLHVDDSVASQCSAFTWPRVERSSS